MNYSLKNWLFTVGIVFVGLFLYLYFDTPKQPKEIRLATGPLGSDSYAYGLSYQVLLASEGVTVTLIPTRGSLDTIAALDGKRADIGFVQSGILAHSSEFNLESLASVYYEPMWIFYHNRSGKFDYLIEATGKKIGVSITNDGNYALAKQILDANGIDEKNTEINYLFDIDAKKALQSGKIDIFITFANEKNNEVMQLLDDPKMQILSLKRAKAYGQKFTSLKHLVLHEGGIDLFRNIPSEKTEILASVENLVARDGMPDELIRIFLKKVKKIHTGRSFFEGEVGFPNLAYLDSRIHPEAEVYLTLGDSWLEEIFPFWIATNIDRFKLLIIPLLGLLIPLLKSIVPLYVFTIRSKIFKWYKKIYFIDEQLKTSLLDKNRLEELRGMTQQLKIEVESKTKVPLSYMGEYYNLLLHIELLEKKIDQKVSPY